MGRPFYPHEADDPDLDWLVSNFLYERPDFVPVETGMLPLILLPYNNSEEQETGIEFTEETSAVADLDCIEEAEDGDIRSEK